jgi:hypothetical protein
MRYQAENLYCVGLTVRGKFNQEYNFVKSGIFCQFLEEKCDK